jgi:protein subunit release factor A
MDWAEMLERMYQRWADAKGFRVKLLDRLRGAPGPLAARPYDSHSRQMLVGRAAVRRRLL